MRDQPFDPTRRFTLQQGLDAGMTHREMRGRDFQRLHRGVFVAAGPQIDLRMRTQAALLTVADDAHASHQSSAELLELWVERDPAVHLCRAAPHRTNRPGVRSHQCQQHGDNRAVGEIWTRDGISLSSPIRTFLEMSDTASLVPLVVLGDSIVRRKSATPELLQEVSARFTGDGALRAREAAALVRPGVDSRPESHLRLLLTFGGLPEPEVNIVLRDAQGFWLRRMELGYRKYGVAAECDGVGHRADDKTWGNDLMRREELEIGGWLDIVVLKAGIYRRPAETVDRVQRALASRGWRGRLRPRADFVRHFPSY